MTSIEITILGLTLAAIAAIFLIAGLFRQRTRPCPRCGRGVTLGVLDCKHCGFDFRTI